MYFEVFVGNIHFVFKAKEMVFTNSRTYSGQIHIRQTWVNTYVIHKNIDIILNSCYKLCFCQKK